jgi:hypothetical protein
VLNALLVPWHNVSQCGQRRRPQDMEGCCRYICIGSLCKVPTRAGPSVWSLGVYTMLQSVNVDPSPCWADVNFVMNVQVV